MKSLVCAILHIALLVHAGALAAQPKAIFSIDLPPRPCVPSVVTFTDQSQGDIASRRWFLNGYFFSQQKNPSRTFVLGGTYEICLEVADTQGRTDRLCKSFNLKNTPSIDFQADRTSGCAPMEVNFKASSNSTITSWKWDFGDGNVVTTTVPTIKHTFINSNNYTISLSALETNGCEGSISKPAYIKLGQAIAVEISATDKLGCGAPHLVKFGNNMPNSDVHDFLWNFGDGQTSDLHSPEHTYTQEGVYDVALTVTNPNTGCSGSQTKHDFVTVGKAAVFSYTTTNIDDCGKTEVAFSLEHAGEIASAHWDFGDGETSTSTAPKHVYTSGGCFYPKVEIVTKGGCSATYQPASCITIQSAGNLDYTVASGALEACDIPHKVTFSTDFNGPVKWTFGAAGTSTSHSPTVSFTEFGDYPITLSVQMDNGCQQAITKSTVRIRPLEPDFSADVQLGCKTLDVQLSSTLGNAMPIASYDWQIGDNISASGASPFISLDKAGDYDVQLIVTSISGCRDTIFKENYLQVGEKVGVSFEAQPRVNCATNEIAFTSFVENDSIDTWLWEFGDGSYSSEEFPKHQYQDTGYFDVKLTVWYNGCEDTIRINDYIHILPPKARFGFANNCASNGKIDFQNKSLGADSWEWDFGEGNKSSEWSPSHNYASEGLYIVLLSVFNNETGCTDHTADTVSVNFVSAAFTLPANEGCAPLKVLPENISSGAESYTWIAEGVAISKQNDPSPELRFPNPGIYTGITLVATNASACADTFVYPDTVFVYGAKAQFTFETMDLQCEGQPIRFTDTSTDAFSEIVEWAWDFGDGNTSSERHPTHIYTSSGDYKPQLTVTNAYGCTSAQSVQAPVRIELPGVAFSIPNNICKNDTLFLVNDNPADFVSFEWDFGNGQKASSSEPFVVYDKSGQYSICLIGTTALGCTSSLCKDITIESSNPDFIGDKLSASCPILEVHFSDLSTDAIKWTWDFGDNSGVSTLQHPVHNYTQGGFYTVCLTSETANGCRETHCKNDYIQIGGPSGGFSFSPDKGCIGTEIAFNGSSNHKVRGSWDFGDGLAADNDTFALRHSATHAYQTVGQFFPVFLMTDEGGCQVAIKSPKPVVIYPTPIAEIDATEKVVCIGQSIRLQGNSQYGTAVWSPSDYLDCTDCPSPVSTPQKSTTYYFTTTSPGGCSASDSILVVRKEVLPPSLAISAIDTVLCPGEMTQLYAQSDQKNLDFFKWDNTREGLSCYDGCNNPFSKPLQSTQYILSVSDANGCVTNDSIYIKNIADEIQFIGTDQTICKGDSIALQIGQALAANWSPANSLSCSACASPLASPLSTTTYQATVDYKGCKLTDTITINVLDDSSIDMQEDFSICKGEPAMLYVLTELAFDSTKWFVDGALVNNNGYEVDLQPSQSAHYVFEGTLGHCTLRDSVLVSVLDKTDIRVEDVEVCVGDSIRLNATGNARNFQWSPSKYLDNAQSASPIAFVKNNTVFTVIGQTGTCAADTVSLTVKVRQLPEIQMDNYKMFVPNDQIKLHAIVEMPLSHQYAWWPTQGLSCVNCPDPIASPVEPLTYHVSVTDDFGCTNTDSIRLRLSTNCTEDDIFLPTAFTPNGDGKNDVLYARSLSSIKLFRVYNRWGEMVFESNDKATGWDGTYKGKALNRDVFTYYVEGRCRMDDRPIFKKGDVTLLR
jgi:gliding motility-associated-like protein